MRGYDIATTCGESTCQEQIDKGEAHRCAGDGCGGFFCAAHLYFVKGHKGQRCPACAEELVSANA